MITESIISKVSGFCPTLHDDGEGDDDYLEQLTSLIFLKVPGECSRPTDKRKIPRHYSSLCLNV